MLNVDESQERGDRIASFLTRFSPKTSLDVGCSSGFLVRSLRDLGVEAYGVDVDGSRFLPEIRDSVSILDMSMSSLPFSEGRFDLVTALTSLDYMADFRHALDEIRRVTSRGGLFVMTFATNPEMNFSARPNVFSSQQWIQELKVRGFSVSRQLADDWIWEIGLRPEIAKRPTKHLPRSVLMYFRRMKGSSVDCLISSLGRSGTPSEAR